MSKPRPTDAEFARIVEHKRRNRMAMVDDMPPDWRQAVHDYGLTIVLAFKECGVKKASHVRHLVETVLDEYSPTRGSNSHQGIRNAKGISIDLDAMEAR